MPEITYFCNEYSYEYTNTIQAAMSSSHATGEQKYSRFLKI